MCEASDHRNWLQFAGFTRTRHLGRNSQPGQRYVCSNNVSKHLVLRIVTTDRTILTVSSLHHGSSAVFDAATPRDRSNSRASKTSLIRCKKWHRLRPPVTSFVA